MAISVINPIQIEVFNLLKLMKDINLLRRNNQLHPKLQPLPLKRSKKIRFRLVMVHQKDGTLWGVVFLV